VRNRTEEISTTRGGGQKDIPHLGLGNNLDGDVLALEVALLALGSAGEAKVAAPHLPAKVVLGGEVPGVAEALVQPQVWLAALGDGRLVGLDRAVAPRQQRTDVLGGRRRRERALEPAARRRGRDAGVGVGRRALVAGGRERARQVEGELALLGRPRRLHRRRRRPIVAAARRRAVGYVVLLRHRRLLDRCRLAVAEAHGDRRIKKRWDLSSEFENSAGQRFTSYSRTHHCIAESWRQDAINPHQIRRLEKGAPSQPRSRAFRSRGIQSEQQSFAEWEERGGRS